MTAAQISFMQTAAFAVKTPAGATIRFHLEGQWNGLEEWRDERGRKLIVSRERGSGFAALFGGQLGERGSATVIAGTADLIAELAPQQAQSPGDPATSKA